MKRILEELRGGRLLHYLTKVHDGDLIGEVVHYRKIMRDEDIRQPQLLLEVLKQVQDLGLDRDIQG